MKSNIFEKKEAKKGDKSLLRRLDNNNKNNNKHILFVVKRAEFECNKYIIYDDSHD